MVTLERQIGGWGTPHLKDAEALGILEGHVKAWLKHLRQTRRDKHGYTDEQLKKYRCKKTAARYRAGIVPPFAKT